MDSIDPPSSIIKSAFEEIFSFSEKAFGEKFGFLSVEFQGRTKIAENKITGVWFNQSFTSEKDRFHVVFFNTQTLNDKGEIENCHNCQPDISEATYQFTPSGWKLVSKKLNFDTFGSWGYAPDIKVAETMQLSPRITVFMVPFSYSIQGDTDSGVGLFEFKNNDWRYIGYIHLEYSTEGSCNCYAYSGTLSKIAGSNPEYPDLLVTVKGTVMDFDADKIVPAKNITYRFDGTKYKSKDDVGIYNLPTL
ncbi:hypothetical protein [Methyloglobulus sp.]|uniref:hypothetical protein n=1 Tax=Methyloglobulus sp. TaxID=2518622 RepID=UPI0032B70FA9